MDSIKLKLRQKNISNVLEILILGMMVWGIYKFNQDNTSAYRFASDNEALRIIIDVAIILVILFRSFHIVKNFAKDYTALGRLKIVEKVAYAICILALLPDLVVWWQWVYVAQVYLPNFIFFLLPILFWTGEIIKRSSITK